MFGMTERNEKQSIIENNLCTVYYVIITFLDIICRRLVSTVLVVACGHWTASDVVDGNGGYMDPLTRVALCRLSSSARCSSAGRSL